MGEHVDSHSRRRTAPDAVHVSVNVSTSSWDEKGVTTRITEATIESQSQMEESKRHLPFPRKLAYGVGHVFNDMCASMWFTYLLIFYHKVVPIQNPYAGFLLLIGQIADAMATPVVGFLCDKTRLRYGRRKIWHLAGTIMVVVSFFFFWHQCLLCNPSTALGWKLLYFAVPIVIFQFGWASVQISHLSLIPELTENESERVGLNAIRYAFTILANMGVFVALFVLLKVIGESEPGSDNSSNLNPSDEWIFSGTALGIIGVGCVFTLIFHLFTREPSTPLEQRSEVARGRKLAWYKWFIKPQFYLVAVIYMCTRLIVNLTQVYTPLYLVDTLSLSKTSVAIGPMAIYISGFVTTLVLRLLNRVIGRYMAYFCGLAFVWGALLWFWQQPVPQTTAESVIIYGATILLGAGGSTLLVTSLSMVADLIGCTTGSSAFVYGLMSFTDKLSNGVVIQIIQIMHPCHAQICCEACVAYYRNVLSFVPGGASFIAFVALGFLVLLIYLRRRQCKDVAPPVAACQGSGPCAKANSEDSQKDSLLASTEKSMETTASGTSPTAEKKPLIGTHT